MSSSLNKLLIRYHFCCSIIITGIGTCMFYTCRKKMYVLPNQSLGSHATLAHTMDGIIIYYFGQFLYCTYLIIILSYRNIPSPVQSVSQFNYIAQTINSLIVLSLFALYLITLAAPTYFILYNTFITGTGTCMFYTCWRGMYGQLRQSFEGHAALTHTMDGITSFEFISILYLSLKLFSQNFIFLAYFVIVILISQSV